MSLAPGRQNDMRMLEGRLATAKSAHEKDVVSNKMAYLVREGNDKEIVKLRHMLVSAAREGDNEKGEAISEEIFKRQGRIK